MKIAVITEDGKTISQRPGGASYYQVLTIEKGRIIHAETRRMVNHDQTPAAKPEEHRQDPYDADSTAPSENARTAPAMDDCQIVFCGGLGLSSTDNLRSMDIQPFITGLLRDIEQAVQKHIEDRLVDHTQKVH